MNIKPTKKYTQEFIDFVVENYPTKGNKFCAEHLNVTQNVINNFCCKHKIKSIFVPKYKPVNMEQFYNIENSNVVYWLGLMWADGHVKRNSIAHVSLNLEVEDANRIFESIKDIADFAVYDVPKINSPSKPQKCFVLYDRNIHKFLAEMDYEVKSYVSPTKILERIPKKLHKKFWLGFMDGDGCISKCKAPEGFKFSLSFHGTHNQDWSSLQEFITDLGCNYNLYQRNLDKCPDTGSTIKICSKYESLHVCSLLYDTYEEDKIGNSRKYNRFLELKEACLTKSNSILGYRGVILLSSSKNFYAKYNKKNISTHQNPADAARAYDLHVVGVLGLRARTNFPLSNYIRVGFSEIYS